MSTQESNSLDTPAYRDFMQLVTKRYSCRKYLDRPVPTELVELILESARLAPSACNRQPWTFLVANTPELCREIAACYGRDWLENVGTYIVAIGHHDQAWHRADDNKDHTDVDLSIATEHICLAATTLGLGTCWICNFDAPKLRTVLNLPEGLEAIAIIPVGYPDPTMPIPVKNRKPADELIKWGKY